MDAGITTATDCPESGGAEFMGLDLATATPEQLGKIVELLSSLIGMYSETVRSAQERYEKDRAFLASLMAELTRVTHFIARTGAEALESTNEPPHQTR